MKQNSFQIGLVAILGCIVIGLQLQGCFGGEDKYKKCIKDWNALNPDIHSIAFLMVKKLNCTPFHNCSGANCNGNGLGHDFKLRIIIEHCSKPIKIGLKITTNGKSVPDIILINDTETPVLTLPSLVSIHVKPVIMKTERNITIKATICAVINVPVIGIQRRCHNIGNGLVLPINQRACLSTATTNATTTAAPSLLSTKSGNVPSTKAASGIVKSTTTKRHLVTTPHLQSNQTNTSKGTSSKPKVVSTGKPTTANSTPNTPSTTRFTTKSPKQSTQTTPKHTHTGKKEYTGKKEKSSKGPPLSTGGKVAISASVILLALVGVGLFAYWRRLRIRRPAYYNDISINSPTDEDVDDDEEPLFNSHLVL